MVAGFFKITFAKIRFVTNFFRNGIKTFPGYVVTGGNISKDITHIRGSTLRYNHLNLPARVTFDNGNYVSYTYDAAGIKLSKEAKTDGNVTVTDYIAGMHYVDGNLSFFQHSEGRVLNNSGSFAYEYNLTDHLGNVRVSVDAAGNVVQKDDYYPFGMTYNSWISAVPKNNYKFNGNEVQEEIPNVADFNARFYDAALGRFMMMDPLAEIQNDFTPYHFSYCNPVTLNDPSGLMPGLDDGAGHIASTFVDKTENIVEHRDDGDNTVYLVGDDWKSTGSNADKSGLSIIGYEDPNMNYKKGDIYTYFSPSEDGYDFASLLNYLNNITSTSMAMVTSQQIKSMLDNMKVNFIPIFNEAETEVIGFIPKGRGASLYKFARFVKGGLELVGPAGDVVLTIYNTGQFASGEMSGGRYSFNLAGTGLGLYATYAGGGPAGIAVGTIFLVGDVFYEALEVTSALRQSTAETSRFRIHPPKGASWYEPKFWKSIYRSMSTFMPH